MTLALSLLIVAFPLGAAVVIGLLTFAGITASEREERITGGLMRAGAAGALASVVLLALLRWRGAPMPADAGLAWFASGELRASLTFLADALSLGLAGLFAAACLASGRFAAHYMHRDAGFHRFFFVLSLFTAAILLVVTSGDALVTFAGWEITGFCSYLLIAYFHDRRAAAANATRVFVTARVGDAAFLLGTLLAFAWLGSTSWQTLAGAPLDGPRTTVLAACFALAAMVKAAQVPFAPWLGRAMEGPTPSSGLFYGAVLVHGGIYLLLRLAPLLDRAPVVAAALVLVGLVTAAYGVGCGLAQTDMKSALAFSALGQLGLMVAACGLGWTRLAAVHLVAHATWRGYQFFTAPSVLAQTHGERMRPVPAWLGARTALYGAALNRGWLDELATRLAVRPVERLAHDLARVDTAVFDRATGLPAPAVGALSSLAGWEEQRIGPSRILAAGADEFASGRGVVGGVTAWAARVSDWFEDRLVVKTISGGAANGAHRLGASLEWLERQLERPAVVVGAVVVSLLALLSRVPN